MADMFQQDYLPNNDKQSRDLFAILEKYAPGAIEAISKTLPATAQGQLSAAQGTASGYNDLYNTQNLAASQTEADVAGGPGAKLVGLADTYQKQLDPEYYAQRGAINDALTKYLGSYDPNNLSPTELAQISRGINATTGPVSSSNLNTIKNAQTFGAAGTQRWKNFGDAITQAAATIPTLKSGISGIGTATARGTNNAATTAATNALASNFGFSTSALNNITGAANMILQKTPIKDAWDKQESQSRTFSNIAGGVGGMSGIGSDRNIKENFKPVETGEILNRLSLMPVERWNYKGDNITHIGPMAQDFQEAFKLGDGKTISLVDANGILVASIQGLLKRVEELEKKIKE